MKKLRSVVAFLNQWDDVIFSAFWAGMALFFVMSGALYALPFPLLCVMQHFRVMQEKRLRKEACDYFHKCTDILLDTQTELITELAKAVGPKIPNDIIRRCLERIQNSDKKDPPGPSLIDKAKDKINEMATKTIATKVFQ